MGTWVLARAPAAPRARLVADPCTSFQSRLCRYDDADRREPWYSARRFRVSHHPSRSRPSDLIRRTCGGGVLPPVRRDLDGGGPRRSPQDRAGQLPARHPARDRLSPPDADPYGAEVYEQGPIRTSSVFIRCEMLLVEEDEPGLFVYRLVRGGHRQLGSACTVDAAEYASGTESASHEKTRPEEGGRSDPAPRRLERPRGGRVPGVPGCRPHRR